MGFVELVYDPEKGLFSLGVLVTYVGSQGTKQVPLEMYVDTGATVSMISEEKALELGIDPSALPTRPTGGVTAMKFLRTVPSDSGLSIMVANEKQIYPEMRISEPIKETRRRKKGPLVQTRTLKLDPVNLFGMDSLRRLRARVIVDGSVDPPRGRIEWN
jgi:hypothetical protein